MSRPFRVWALVAMLAVLVATSASRLMSYVIRLLTDAAIAFGQGRADVGEIWHRALVFLLPAISGIPLESLRRAVALVPQTTSLFHRTILENIRYGRLEASDDEVMEAARLAQADRFVELLPEKKYATRVGERGVKLSGGQTAGTPT